MIINNNVVEANFLKIPDETKYWFVRAGVKAEFYQDFKYNNIIAIGDNDITLKNLENIEDKHRQATDTYKAAYKKIFNQFYIGTLKDSIQYKKMDLTEKKEAEESAKRSSTISANKTFSFVEEMMIGDYILVPYKKSEAFMIGIIISDTFSEDVKRELITEDSKYKITDYQKKRNVIWVKEIDFKELPDQLSWILNAQRAIFDISKDAQVINPLLSSEYIYKGSVHARIDVGTPEKIDTETWLNYQTVMFNNAQGKADELYQKNKVQSEGQTLLEMAIENKETILFVLAALFSDFPIEIGAFKIAWRGPLAYLIPGVKEQRNLDIKKQELELSKSEEELKGLKLDNEAKIIANTKERIDLNRISEDFEELIEQHEEFIELEKTLLTKKGVSEQSSLDKMRITQKTIGSEISIEKQVSNLMSAKDEF